MANKKMWKAYLQHRASGVLKFTKFIFSFSGSCDLSHVEILSGVLALPAQWYHMWPVHRCAWEASATTSLSSRHSSSGETPSSKRSRSSRWKFSRAVALNFAMLVSIATALRRSTETISSWPLKGILKVGRDRRTEVEVDGVPDHIIEIR